MEKKSKGKTHAPNYKPLLVLVYSLYILTYIFGVTVAILAIIIAYLLRAKTNELSSSHITFQIRGFWIGIVCFFIIQIAYIAVFAIIMIGMIGMNYSPSNENNLYPVSETIASLSTAHMADYWGKYGTDNLLSYLLDNILNPLQSISFALLNYQPPFNGKLMLFKQIYLPFNATSLGPASYLFFIWWAIRNGRGLYYLIRNKKYPAPYSYFL